MLQGPRRLQPLDPHTQTVSEVHLQPRLLWLVNVCLFIAYLNVSHAVYLLFVLRCAWNCSINRVNRVCCRRVSLSLSVLSRWPEVNGTQGA